MLNRRNAVRALAASLIGLPLFAQSPEDLNLSAVGKDAHWKLAGRSASLVEEKGKHALKLSEGDGMGLVWLDGFAFDSGVIDVDLLGRSQPIQGSFLGIAFRVTGERVQDVVYFRPFNFRANDPARRSHAVQYASHPLWPWQKLRSQHPGEYERAVMPAPDGDQWFHARVVIERPIVSVFVNDAPQPCLVVTELTNRAGGAIGLWVGEGSGGYFANLQVTRRH